MKFSKPNFYFLVNAQQFHGLSWQYEFKALEMCKDIHLSISIV